MNIAEMKKLLPPQRPVYTDEELERFTVEDLYRMKLTADETVRLREINERRRQETARKAKEWRKAQQPLVEELRAAGFDVESVWDLFNRKEPWNKKERVRPYPEAVPILLKHLPRDYPAAVREGIARALALPEAKVGWDLLIQLYRDESEKRAKDGLAVAISGAADDDVIGDVIALARDPRHGSSRLLLLLALERSADPRARAALMELGTDPDLKKEIPVVLGRLKRKKERSGGAAR